MRKLWVLFVTLLPILAHAEVMDKEHSLVTVLVFPLVASIAVYWVARRKPWLLAVLLPVVGLLIFGHLSDVADPNVGPTISAEAGPFYVVASWAAPVIVLVGCVVGLTYRDSHAQPRT